MVIPTSFSTPTLIDCCCLDLDLKNKEKRSSSGSSWCWGAFIVSPPSQSSSLLHILMPVPNVPTIILTVQSGHGESQRCVSPPSDVHFSKIWNRERCSAGTPGPRATRSWAEIPATREPRMLAYATPISAHRHVLCIPSQKHPVMFLSTLERFTGSEMSGTNSRLRPMTLRIQARKKIAWDKATHEIQYI
jgi:hypothetical protein